jgi:putative FmdB family regulatory protein
MPIYEYQCPQCNTVFEELVRSSAGARGVVCPHCGHRNVARRLSTFAAHSAPSRRAAPPGPCGQCPGIDGGCPLGQ